MTTNLPKNVVEMLYVDDERRATLTKRRLEKEFLAFNCELRLQFSQDPDEACQLIEHRPGRPFDVVVTDLLFPETSDATGPLDSFGLDVIQQTRASSTETVIVAITGYEDRFPNLGRDAYAMGADKFYTREQLLSVSGLGGLSAMIRFVYEELGNRGLVVVGPELDYDRDEPGILSVVDEVGTVTLRLLMEEVLATDGTRPPRATVRFITPGASGARIISAAATWPDGARRRFLIKISRDFEALSRELTKAGGAVGMYSPTLVLQHLRADRPFGGRNGWWAIAAPQAHAAEPLHQWLTRRIPETQIALVMQRLFLEGGLADGYADPVINHGRRPVEPLMLNPLRRARARAAVEELSPALSHPDAAAMLDSALAIKAVGDFGRTGALPGGRRVNEIGGDPLVVFGHGDLHTGNVLVTLGESPAPLVIDLAEFGHQHWATDIARLSVDLILRCLDIGVASMTWELFPRWRALAYSYARFEYADDPGKGNEGVLAALKWLRDHKALVLPLHVDAAHTWEWHIALAEQWLRGMSRNALAAPKRALALAAAYDQLVLAAEIAPPPQSTF